MSELNRIRIGTVFEKEGSDYGDGRPIPTYYWVVGEITYERDLVLVDNWRTMVYAYRRDDTNIQERLPIENLLNAVAEGILKPVLT